MKWDKPLLQMLWKLDEFPHAFHSADFQHINKRGTGVDMTLPSKLTSYLAAVSPDTETALPSKSLKEAS